MFQNILNRFFNKFETYRLAKYFIVTFTLLVITFSTASKMELVNADTLTSLVFAHDLVNGLSLKEWQLAPAPAVFSEIIPAVIATAIGQDAYMHLVLIQLFQVLILFLLFYYISKSFNLRKPLQTTLITMIVLGYGVCFDRYWLFYIFNNMHMGALFLGLLSILCLNGFFKNQGSIIADFRYTFALFVLGVLAVFESKLYYVHFSLPALLLIVSTLEFKKDTRAFYKTVLGIICISLPLAVGMLIVKLLPMLDATQEYPMSGLKAVTSSINIFRESLGFFIFHYSGVIGRVAALVTIVILARAISSNYKAGLSFGKQLYTLTWTSIHFWTVVPSICIIIVFIISGRFRMPVYDLRYFVLPLLLQALWLIDLLLLNLQKKPTALVVLALLFLPLVDSIRGSKINKNYDNLIQCLKNPPQNTQLADGVSGYWMAKPVEHYSNYTIHMTQLTPEFHFFKWMNRIDTMSTKRNGDKPYFNFIIEDWWLTKKRIEAYVGPADEIFECTGGPYNNGYEAYPHTTVKVHYYKTDLLDKYIKQLD